MGNADRSSEFCSDLAAIVLCGGRSRRMGTDKAAVRLGERSLLQHVVDQLQPLCQITVVAAVGQSLPSLPHEVHVTRDEFPDQGPLAGLLTGLNELQKQQASADFVWVTGSDTPLVDANIVRAVWSRLEDFDVAVVEHQSRWNPLLAVYRRSLQSKLQAAYDSGERSLYACLQSLSCVVVPSDDVATSMQLINVNTPDTLRQLQENRRGPSGRGGCDPTVTSRDETE